MASREFSRCHLNEWLYQRSQYWKTWRRLKGGEVFVITDRTLSWHWRAFLNYRSSCFSIQWSLPMGNSNSKWPLYCAAGKKKQVADNWRNKKANGMDQTTGHLMLHFTRAWRLQKDGLYAWQCLCYVPLRPAHQRDQFLWCQEYKNWTQEKWNQVLFMDENQWDLIW